MGVARHHRAPGAGAWPGCQDHHDGQLRRQRPGVRALWRVSRRCAVPGLHKFQCCIHPWMRAAVRVE